MGTCEWNTSLSYVWYHLLNCAYIDFFYIYCWKCLCRHNPIEPPACWSSYTHTVVSGTIFLSSVPKSTSKVCAVTSYSLVSAISCTTRVAASSRPPHALWDDRDSSSFVPLLSLAPSAWWVVPCTSCCCPCPFVPCHLSYGTCPLLRGAAVSGCWFFLFLPTFIFVLVARSFLTENLVFLGWFRFSPLEIWHTRSSTRMYLF